MKENLRDGPLHRIAADWCRYALSQEPIRQSGTVYDVGPQT